MGLRPLLGFEGSHRDQDSLQGVLRIQSLDGSLVHLFDIFLAFADDFFHLLVGFAQLVLDYQLLQLHLPVAFLLVTSSIADVIAGSFEAFLGLGFGLGSRFGRRRWDRDKDA